MKALLDTCIIMDFLQNREPFAQEAKKIIQAAAMNLFTGCITAKAATDIYYLTHRCIHSDKESRSKLNQLFTIIGMLDSMADDIFHAISSDIKDFEDAVMIETALRSKMDCIVTRNEKDYANASIAIYTPKEFIKILEKDE
ncbi:MAG: PIN domain-containing protein [Clostridium sp.]|nr:PIN domain-containing protein [Lachnoclostridium sp.]MCM1251453.1 PIN domain-containing protein [Clostridium sp.]